ncbi:nucleotidyltransferase domain-containing protein [Nocardia sp. NPDC049190]|uniref:nucleotidyltransferase domain-containing protein n=1 Tax=Nocardia sp. NPDC049190 TaxID=3155650 RepID=UPI0034018F11
MAGKQDGATWNRRIEGCGMTLSVLTKLAEANRPEQFALLERVAERLSSSDAVTALLVRGSLARGTADRLSDIDFVVGVEDSRFEDYVSVLDALATTELGSILPGWRDSIVGHMGGLGFVYLIGWAGQLQQLDLYVAPASCIGQVQEHTVCQTIFTRDRTADYKPKAQTTRFVSDETNRPRSCTDLLVEVMVIGYLIRKRISRGQQLIAYSEVFLFNTAAKNLIKAALAPRSTYYGWYQLEAEVGVTPIGRECLAHLMALISAPGIPTVASLTDGLNRVFAVAEMATPEAIGTIRDAIDAYRHYLELP